MRKIFIGQHLRTNNLLSHIAIAIIFGMLLGFICLKFPPLWALVALMGGGFAYVVLKRPEIALLGILLCTSSIIFENKLPPKGSNLLPKKSICDECPREKKDKKLTEIKRIYEIDDDFKSCFWDQSVVCMGPATQAGCGAQCPNVNIPCTGCDGPGPLVVDQGAAIVSALASIATDPKVIEQVVDPIGTFYKYSLARSILRRRVSK